MIKKRKIDHLQEEITKADILVEALPYMQAYRDKTVLIKFGGSAMDDPELVKSLMRDIVVMEAMGLNPVVVHGGGKAITKAMAEAGLEAKFINGLRVTTKEAINIVEDTLSAHINPGLVEMMGGKARFEAMLDSVMTLPPVFDDSYYGFVIHEIREMQIMNMGQYAHGNQPVQHMLYLYGYCAQPWKTQYWVREVMNNLYSAAPDGYCGDEDNGQTSAWYVFSALGFYPVCPGSGQYVIGTPYFSKTTLHLENGKKIEIDADDISDNNRYIDQLKVNGKAYDLNYLEISTLQKGAKIKFKMTKHPNTQRGISSTSTPYSFSE